MKKMIWITTLFVVFLIFILPGIVALGVKYIPSGVQPPLHKTRDVFGKFQISQEFTSVRNGLTGFSMTIKNPNLKNKKDVYLYLFDDQKTLIRESKLNGSNIEDGSYVKFLFDPVLGSENKNYKFVLSSPDAGEEEVLPIFFTEEKPLWVGLMMYDIEEIPGGVSFVTLHTPESKLSIVKDLYSSWISRLLFPRSQKTY
jgi:hypothetical protein